MQSESIIQKVPSELIRVLLLEDNPGYAELIRIMLHKVSDTRFDVENVKRLSDGLQSLKNKNYDVVLLDLKLPDSQGIDTFDKVSAQAQGVPIIVLTVTDNDQLAFEAVQKGAQDYLVKERVERKSLVHSIRYAIERKHAEEMLKDHRTYLEEQVTERTAELRESEERYRTFFEQSKDVIFVTSREGAVLNVNQAALELFGYTKDEMMTMNAREWYVDSADHKRFQRLIELEKSVQDFEVTLRKKDGTKMDCLLTATVRQADDGGISGYQGIIRDITDRKRIETQLREQALIFENISDGIIMIDLEGNIMSWNPAAERMFGYYQDEVFQKTIDILTKKVMHVKLRSDRWIGEIDFVREDGTEGICETTLIPLCDEGGNIIAMFGVCRDVTDRKQSAEQLQRSYDQLRETFIATVNILSLIHISEPTRPY